MPADDSKLYAYVLDGTGDKRAYLLSENEVMGLCASKANKL